MASNAPTQPDNAQQMVFLLTPIGRFPREALPRMDRATVSSQMGPSLQSINSPTLEQTAEREPNSEPQQMPRRDEMPEDAPQMLRAVQSSPHLTSTPNTQQFRREMRSAMVRQNQQNGEFGNEIRMSRSHSAVYNWLAFDSPRPVNELETNLDLAPTPAPAQNYERIPADDAEREDPDSATRATSSASAIVDIGRLYSNAFDAFEWSIPTILWLWQYRLFRFLVILLTLYFGLGLVERWAITLTATIVGWAWPPVHFILGSARGSLYYLTGWCSWMDEFLSGWFCEMAARYCRQYDAMCDNQCSFVGRVAQRVAVFGRRF
uniref:Caveolin n=1 Tax=Globodera rostochiensis TaxID=31243 RepID=A0A914I687_GLORO